MLDQDTAIALLTVAKETDATVALVGDRAQLPAVGRGGVLDIACELKQDTHDLTAVHRFTDAKYADLTRDMRNGANATDLYHRLDDLGLVEVHNDAEAAMAAIAAERARDRADRGLTHATQAALAAVAPLAVDGPVAIVNTERDRLAKVIADAERLAEAWAQAGRVATQRFNRYLRDSAAASTALAATRQRLDQARQTALAPLLAQAHTDARTLTASWETVVAANREARKAGRFGKIAATRAVSVADARYSHLEAEVTARWGSAPMPGGSPIGWARSVAEPLAEAAPAVTTAKETVEQARQRVRQVGEENVAEMRSQRLPRQRAANGRPDREAAAWTTCHCFWRYYQLRSPRESSDPAEV